MIMLRAPNLAADDYRALARSVYPPLSKSIKPCCGTVRPMCCKRISLTVCTCHMVHVDKRPVADGLWFSLPVHGLEDMSSVQRLAPDFVTLSPVKLTQTHPELTEPLGWSGFAAIAESLTCPAFALGGLSVEDEHQAIAHGAQGIAAIRTFLS